MSEIDIGNLINEKTPPKSESFVPPTQNTGEVNQPENFDPVEESEGATEIGGEVFDPKIHCVGRDGQPRKTKNGKFRRKRQKAEVKIEIENQAFGASPPLSTVQIVQMIVTNTSILASQYWGDEWKLKIDEEALLTDTYSRYVHFKGWDSALTPEAVVIGVTISVFLPRLLGPGFKNWLSKMMGSKNAYHNNRTNSNGQNNAGQNNSSAGGQGGKDGPSSGPVPREPMGGTLGYRSIS